MLGQPLRILVIIVAILSILLCTILFTIYLVRNRSSSVTSTSFSPSAPPSAPAPAPPSPSPPASPPTSPPPGLVCPRPTVYSSNYDFDYTKHAHESQNLHGTIDYFRFVLSWSPTFCLNQTGKNHFQCQHSFGLIVHGLWPSSRNGSHPRNCRNEPPIPIDLINKYFCLMPSEYMMQSEWEKHGTCFWNHAKDYFHQIEQLYSKLRPPPNLPKILNETNLTKKMRHDKIQKAFLQLNPTIPSTALEIILKAAGTLLKEIVFCYDLHFHYTHCH